MVDPPLFSASVAHGLINATPLHVRTALETPEEPSEIMEVGTVAHQVILERDASRISVLDFPDWRTKAAREAREAARTAGRTPILAHRWAKVEKMVLTVTGQLLDLHPMPFGIEGVAESSLYFEEQGVKCRATPDWLSLDHLYVYDLKTTGSAHPGLFSRTLWDKGYALQEALYRRGVKRVYDIDAEFVFVVVEVEPPYALSMVALDPEAQVFADMQLDHALDLWKRCLETDQWPGYPTRSCYAEVPAYLRTQYEMRGYYNGVFLPPGDAGPSGPAGGASGPLGIRQDL
jgi:hypothetical protein